jgi:long-chain acyl-CoA synthetase
VTCTVLQQPDQRRLYDAVSLAVRTGGAFAVLDPGWPQFFLGMATGRIRDAVSDGVVGDGDMVVFSSGSTGRPRGIVRTIESWQTSVPSFSDISGITDDDEVWLPGPLWSSLFLFGAFHAGAVGATVAFQHDEPAGATALHCVPSQLPGLLHRAETGGLPLVRRVVVAGDHCSDDLRERCEGAGWQVLEYYGASELSFVAWRDRAGPFRAFPGVETQLRAETGLSPGTEPTQGVLWARSRYLADGYLTAPTDGPLRFDPQGWATVSDVARAVPGGLKILGRGDSAVTSGGHTVLVEEVERLLRGLPGVDDVAVLGVPHPRLGQLLTAVVVGSAVDGTLRAAVAGMPAPARPRRWLHARALPRTSGGKLRREALPELVMTFNERMKADGP